ncbi:hypothetical protein [Sphingomonas sp.]|uniref:hypothetical protein n=1 Tax=Sphingomonas sp. TaxID=28214 RepID=UPI0017A3387E|nr:hypothetical protein [Sphingomonas sp.]MBA3510450.1 hypothetical protein [Sphingomonas sp.]
MTNPTKTGLDRLRELQADCGDNKHDQATALIAACILEGLNTAGQIVGALTTLGMNPAHVRIMLKEGTGGDPARHHWRRDEEGRYHLLEAAHDLAA